MKAISLFFASIMLALVGALVVVAGTDAAPPSQQDSAPSETPFTPSSTPTVTPTPEPIRLSGLITLNGVVAPPSLSISVLNADKNVCGETITQQGGRYEILLGSNCPAGTTASLRLEAVPDAVGTPVTLSEEPQQDATIEFGTIELGLLSVSDLRTLGVLTDPEAVEAAVSDVVTAAEEAAAAAEDLKLELGGDPVVSEKMILSVLVIALIGALIVLGFLAGLKFYGRRESEVKFDKEIEALVLILVLASILLFGVSGLMTAQGIVAVLSLIAGFALGRQTSS